MPDGPEVHPRLKLHQEGNALTGTSSIRTGTEAPITNAIVEGDTLRFEVVRQQHGRALVTRYQGRREGNRIIGQVESGWAGEKRTYAWEARRQAGIEGTWKWSTTFGTRKVDSRLTLKLDGDVLTGSMPGFGRDTRPSEIRNATYKDGEVTFEIERGRGDFHSITKFQGKLEGDSLKGTTELTLDNREPRTDDWEATRAE